MPIIRLDLSNGKYYEKEGGHPTINVILEQQEKKFGITEPKASTNYDLRLTNLTQVAYQQTDADCQ